VVETMASMEGLKIYIAWFVILLMPGVLDLTPRYWGGYAILYWCVWICRTSVQRWLLKILSFLLEFLCIEELWDK
jgi:hypothetical protein